MGLRLPELIREVHLELYRGQDDGYPALVSEVSR